MTDRPPERPTPANGFSDPTRDIRLPSLPGRPAPAVPTEWAELHRQPEPEQPKDRDAGPPETGQPGTAQPEPEQPPRNRIADQPTDELGRPPARQRTLAFAAPSGGVGPSAATPPVQMPPGYLPSRRPESGAVPPSGPAVRPGPPPRRRRMWPWVLVLLVLLLLFAAAVVLAWVSGDRDGLQSWWEATAPSGYRVG